MDMKEHGVIQGLQMCQTKEAKWLCLNNIYMKFHRPNMYDIGGTSVKDVADYWFLMQTVQEGKNFLLHIFIVNRHKSSFNLAISCNNKMSFHKKLNVAYLKSSLQKYGFKNVTEMSQNYITTYSFKDIDIDLIKNKNLYISISFNDESVAPCHNFGELLRDPFGADFTIESADVHQFQVHKILLTSRCDVFKAMLREDTAESQNNYVKLIDVCKEDLSCILEFIYTGTIKDIETSNFLSLLMLADRYDLQGLKELSEEILYGQLCSDTVLDVLTAADMYNSEHLKYASLNFLKENPSAIHSNMFSEIKNSQLVQDICKFMVK